MQRAIVLYNPNSRKGKIKKIIPYICKRLLTKFKVCDVQMSKSGKNMENLAYQNAFKYDVIVVVGGDGTIHNVVNGIKRSTCKTIKLGILPYGTCNDVCHTLHIPKKLDKAIDVILRGSSLDYDIMKSDNEYIVYTLSGGMFVKSSFETKRKLKKIFGRVAYFFNGIFELFRLRALPLTFDIDGTKYNGKYLLALLLNTHSTAGFYINGKSSVSDGKMELLLIERKKSYLKGLFTIFVTFLFGISAIKKYKNVHILSCKAVTIENHSQEAFSADGEKCEFLKKTVAIDGYVPIFHGMNI